MLFCEGYRVHLVHKVVCPVQESLSTMGVYPTVLHLPTYYCQYEFLEVKYYLLSAQELAEFWAYPCSSIIHLVGFLV